MTAITVRATTARPAFTGSRDGSPTFQPTRAWRIYRDGYRLDGWYVVDERTGLTVIHDGRMVTSWHGGIGPGDLARHVEKYRGIA